MGKPLTEEVAEIKPNPALKEDDDEDEDVYDNDQEEEFEESPRQKPSS